MSTVFRAALGFLIAFAVLNPHGFAAYVGALPVANLKTELATAEKDEAARFDAHKAAPLDAAIFQAASLLRASARVRDSKL